MPFMRRPPSEARHRGRPGRLWRTPRRGGGSATAETRSWVMADRDAAVLAPQPVSGRGAGAVGSRREPPDRALRPVRGWQGHGRRRGARAVPAGLGVGVVHHPGAAAGGAGRRAIPLRRPRRVRADDRTPASCSSRPSSPATSTARRGRRCSSGWRPASRRCWRSSCRAPDRCARRMPDAQLVFLAPPSWPELERRLIGRGTEERERDRRRLDPARVEMAAEGEFDAVVVNDDVGRAAAELVDCMIERAAARRRDARCGNLPDESKSAGRPTESSTVRRTES